jgi:hypothetical protein
MPTPHGNSSMVQPASNKTAWLLTGGYELGSPEFQEKYLMQVGREVARGRLGATVRKSAHSIIAGNRKWPRASEWRSVTSSLDGFVCRTGAVTRGVKGESEGTGVPERSEERNALDAGAPC